MASKEVLVKTLRNADGKSFQKYRALEGFFDLDDFTLFFDDIQNDPSGYSRMRVRVPLSRSGFPQDAYSCAPRKTALRDLIARRFWESTRVHAKSPVPGASGGEISVPRPGQEILDRGTAVLTPYYIEVRFRAVLPSAGKTVPFRAAEEMIFGRLASIVRESMFFGAYKQSKVYGHVITAENADSIRSRLGGMGLVSFVACGSILPRREDGLAPLSGAVPFDAPADTVISIDVPNGEPVRGLGIPEGLTIVCGGSGHGKSSFLEAILAGVYDHIPEDGREFVITRPDAVMIRREEGRSASGVDVSRFVRRCRECPDPSSFTAERTSSAMSQAVAASEAIESGSGLLLLDENTSEPSVIASGSAKSLLIPAGSEPFIPIIQSIPSSGGPSAIAVTSSTEAIESADRVIVIDGFVAAGVQERERDSPPSKPSVPDRYPMAHNIVFSKGRKEVHVCPSGTRSLEVGTDSVRVPSAALFDTAQTALLADALSACREMADGSRTLRSLVEEAVSGAIARAVSCESGPDAAYARPEDLAAVLNRTPRLVAIRKRSRREQL